MKKNLPSLSLEMAKNGYIEFQDFQVDGRYHLFPLIGNENKPGFYVIRQTSSGLNADYGDYVSGNFYSWRERAEGPLSPEEAAESIRQQDEAVVRFEKRLKLDYEESAREMELFWNEGKELESHRDSESILPGDNDRKKKAKALKSEINKMYDLDPIEQEFERNRLSEKYEIRKGAIDQFMRQLTGCEQDVKGIVEEIAPAAEPVDGAKILDSIFKDITKRVILPTGAAEAVTLWILLTYCYKAFNVLPLLGITSPTKRCGKTTLIEILQGLVSKGLSASSITPAAVFRTVEKCSPTLLIDEADTFLKNNDELRGIINCGHTRGSAFVIRVEGDNHEPVKFSTWGPKAIGMIGTLPDTLKDRAILIQLSRKMPGEKIIKTGLDFVGHSAGIRSMCRRWADDNLARLKSILVAVPGSGNDRADDNWQSLFVIAHAIGGNWPGKVKKSMQQIVSGLVDDGTNGSKLLSDIQGVFEEHSAVRIFSSDLVEQLQALSDSPWSDWNKGRGLSTNGLARLLKPFRVTSKTIRIGENLAKGYTLESFKDTFKRYIPPNSSVTPLQPNGFNKLDGNQNVTQDLNVTGGNQDNPLNSYNCYGVTDGIGVFGHEVPAPKRI